ncbi:hypothetical protein TNCV_1266171 [Trichonephila clavipes]|nr:hypothetical protein TNCV_1266171 [Trichonephila clavipes]
MPKRLKDFGDVTKGFKANVIAYGVFVCEELLRIAGIGRTELWRQPRPVTGCYANKEEVELFKIQSFLKLRIMHQRLGH